MQEIPQLFLLILEDDPHDADLILTQLKKAGVISHGVQAASKEAFVRELENKPDVILVDFNVPGFGAVEALRFLQEQENRTPVIVTTGALNDKAAQECMELGASDYLLKDRLARLGPAILRVYIEHQLRKEKGDALASLSRMAAIVEATSDLVGMSDEEGCISYMNQAGRRMAGYGDDEDLSSLTFRSFATEKALLTLLSEGILGAVRNDSWSGETSLLRRDGTEIPVSQVVIAHGEGGNRYFSTIVRDISARIRSEEALRHSQAWLRGVWEWSGDAMRLSDEEGIIRAVNRDYCKMTGMKEKDLVGQCFTVVFPKDYDFSSEWNRYLRFFEGTGPKERIERKLTLASGKTMHAELTFACIEAEGRGERLLLTIMRDISERKSLEEQFYRSQRQESIGALAGGVAHDFNNILTPVSMAASMLRMDLAPADREKALKTIEDSARRGADVVRRLMTFSKGIDGDRSPQHPQDLVEDVVNIVEQSFPRNIDINKILAPEIPCVEADRTQIHQVLLNLCVNARDAMPEGGTLTFEVRREEVSEKSLPQSPHARSGDFVVLRVTDTGTGIRQEDFERIFDPFFSTKSIQRGTGLGLSTSLGIVRSHRGFLTVTSEVNQGSVFALYLPVFYEISEKPSSVQVARRSESSHGKMILVVDDEIMVRETACQLLKQHGYHAVGVESGYMALRVLQKFPRVAAVLMDLEMPGMAGLEFIRAARESYPSLPILVISGARDLVLGEELLELRVTKIVEKPFQAGQLLQALEVTMSPTGI